MKRRVLSLLLVMALVISVVPAVFATESETTATTAPASAEPGTGTQENPALMPDDYNGMLFDVKAESTFYLYTPSNVEGATFMFEYTGVTVMGYNVGDGTTFAITETQDFNHFYLYKTDVPGQGAAGTYYAVQNTNDFDVQCSVKLKHPLGHNENPRVLTNEQAYGQSPVTFDIPEGIYKYHLLWTPKQDGTMSCEVTSGQDLTTYFIFDFDSGVKNETDDVEAGEFIGIVVENPTGAAVSGVTLSIKFQTSFEGPLDGEGAATYVCKVVPSDDLDAQGTPYASVYQALNAAKSGETVLLLAQSIEDAGAVLVIKPGVTLNLDDQNLICDYLIGLDTGYLTGATYSNSRLYGKLLVDEKGFVMGKTPLCIKEVSDDKDIYMIPVWNPEDNAYVISQAQIYLSMPSAGNILKVGCLDDRTAYMQFYVNFSTDVKKDLVMDGTSDNRIKSVCRVYWQNNTTYKDKDTGNELKVDAMVNQDYALSDSFYAEMYAKVLNSSASNRNAFATIDVSGKPKGDDNKPAVLIEGLLMTDCGIVISLGKYNPNNAVS